MNCYRFEELISDYIENSLTLQDRADAELHLEACGQCREKVIDLEAILSTMNDLPAVSCSDNFMMKLESKVKKTSPQKKTVPVWTLLQKYSRIASAAAAVILVITGFYMTYSAFYPNLTPSGIPQADIQRRVVSPQQNSQSFQTQPQYVSQKINKDSSQTPRPDFKNKIRLVNDTK